MPPIRQPLTPYFVPSVFSFRAGTTQASANDYVFDLLHPSFEEQGSLFVSLEDLQRAMGPQMETRTENHKVFLKLEKGEISAEMQTRKGHAYLPVSPMFQEQLGYFVQWLDTYKGRICVIAQEKPARIDSFGQAYNFTRTVGFLRRAFYMEEVKQLVPFSLYIPTAYQPENPMKMAVVLHGLLGGDVLEKAGPNGLFRAAEQNGYLLCAPTCYARGMHGSPFPMARDFVPADVDPANPAGLDEEQQKIYPLCEKADMTAVEWTMKHYSIDKDNVFLFGNSMGGDGTFHLGQKYNQLWRAIAPCGGGPDLRFYPMERLKDLPVHLLVGTEDPGYDIVNSLYEQLAAQGVEASISRVGGEPHGNAWIAAIDEIFAFFNQHTV